MRPITSARIVTLAAAAALSAAAAVPAAAGAGVVTPTVATLTPPSVLPQGLGVFTAPGSSAPAGAPIPTGSTVLALTFPNGTPSQSTFTVTCPTGTAASAWGNGIVGDGPGASVNVEQFSTMFGGLASASVLCSPAVTATSKVLPKTTKLPAGLVAGDGQPVKMSPKMRRQTRLVRVTLGGLTPNVLSTVTSTICPAGSGILEVTEPANVVIVPLDSGPLVTSQGPATATFTGVCLSNAYNG